MLVNVFDGNWNGGYLVDGGRNLLKDTYMMRAPFWFSKRESKREYDQMLDAYYLPIYSSESTSWIQYIGQDVNITPTIRYILTFYAKRSSNTDPILYVRLDRDENIVYVKSNGKKEYRTTDNWNRYEGELISTYNIEYDEPLTFYTLANTGAVSLDTSIRIGKVKLELGTVATPWTPAPEDTFEEGTKHPNSIFTNTIPVKKKYQYTYGFLNQNSLPAHTIRYMKPDGTWVKAVHVNEDATSGMKSLEIDDDYNIEIMFQNGLTDAQKASFKIMEENFMAIKASNQVSVIDITDGYSVILTNDSYTFLGDTDSVSTTQSTTSQIVAMRGSEIVSCTMGEVTCPNGLSVVSDNKTPSPTLTITATSALTKAGTIDIPIKIGDITIVKKFSFAIAFTGAKGDKGDKGTGVTIKSKAIEYLAGSSGTTAPTGTWQSTIPTVPQGQYLWTRTTVTYSDGNQTVSYSAARQGVNGTSPTVSSSKVQYQQSTSGTTVPTGTWVDTPPAAVAGQYMWSKTTATYSDGKTAVSYNVTRNGSNGAKGDKGDKGAAGADALALVITSSAGVIFKNTSIATTLTAHVYKGGVEMTGTALTALGTIKWYKDGGTTAVATGQTYTISAGDVENKASFTAQLEE